MHAATQNLLLECVAADWRSLASEWQPWGMWIALHPPLPTGADMIDHTSSCAQLAWFLDARGAQVRSTSAYERFRIVHFVQPWCSRPYQEPGQSLGAQTYPIGLAAFAAYSGAWIGARGTPGSMSRKEASVFSFEYDFFPDRSMTDAEEFLQKDLFSYLATLYRNGFLIDQPWNLVELEDRFRLFCLAPSEDTLEVAHCAPRVEDCLKAVLEKSERTPSFRLLGEAVETSGCCDCEDSSWYVLFTTFLEEGPPVQCGDCGYLVPLYRLPLLAGEMDQGSILGWRADYQAYDTLFMGSGAGEQIAYRQMADLDSDLTRDGRRVCQAMADRTGKPWYYYLHRYEEPQHEACPGCGDPWDLDKPLHRLYHYKCDRCCLLSEDPI